LSATRFWFVGAIYLTQIPAYAKEWMHGDETVVTLILTVSVGIALGSMLCEKLSGRKVEIGLVPFGSFGLTVFGAVVAFRRDPGKRRGHSWLECWALHARAVLVDHSRPGFSAASISCRCTLIQSRTAEERARVIAANNILNALFMVVSAIVSIVLLSLVKLSIPAAVPGGVAAEHRRQRLHLQIVPEFTMRFMIWLLSHSMYRVSIATWS
jgi:hypothetical protein